MHRSFDQRRYLIPFRSTLLPQIFTDTMVIGAGAAGLAAAHAAAEHGDVIVLAKGSRTRSNTGWAQGGIAAVLDAADSVASHVRDTLEAGAGLCDQPIVDLVCRRGADAISRLLEAGFAADRNAGDQIALGREGGHSARRIVHSRGDATGAELVRTLLRITDAAPNIRIFENCFALDLLTPSDEVGAPCLGAITHHPRHGLQMIWARATILASGGAGAVWRETSNPPIATGDGLAMAYRAGATLADLAFMQFHPTTLYVAGAERLLISEAVRGEGATLLDANLERFMPAFHERAELAPRDVVAMAIHRTLARTGAPHVWLDARPVSNFADRFPGIAQRLRQFGLDPQTDLIPVNPAAHYMVGGARCDADGRTDVHGLYAVGEASCSGLHGANRLASNSLLEALVLGEAAGRACVEMHAECSSGNGARVRPQPVRIVSEIPPSPRGELDLSDVRSSLRAAMWRNVGIERAGTQLADMVEMCSFWARYTLDKIFDDPAGWETQNMLYLADLAARSALWREESRGCHQREDCPTPVDAYQVHDLWRRGSDTCTTAPVVTELATS
ncbi:MAG: L-aspartate oxidase [Phycisphaerales bacterium]|nr:L-aspartate oxidase [Phycisphaerales bacterium]